MTDCCLCVSADHTQVFFLFLFCLMRILVRLFLHIKRKFRDQLKALCLFNENGFVILGLKSCTSNFVPWLAVIGASLFFSNSSSSFHLLHVCVNCLRRSLPSSSQKAVFLIHSCRLLVLSLILALALYNPEPPSICSG